MTSRLAVVAVVVCVVLAGCSALGFGGGPSGGTPDPGDGGGTDTDPGSTPWGTDRLVVGVSAPAYDNRSFGPAVRSAVEFWNPKTGSETPFEADLVVDPDAADPDIEIRYAPRVEGCDGETGTFYWCAPALSENPDTYTVRVTASLTESGVRNATTRALASALLVEADSVPGVPTVERPRFRDPWPGSPTVVGVDASATDRQVEPLIEAALSFWADADGQYGNYTTEFVLRPEAADPDVLVRFVSDVEDCGRETDDGFAGCAPVLGDHQPAERPTVVRIETGYTDASTLFTLRHEFGHVFGLEHGEGPDSLMNATTERLERLAEPNASERPFPWQSERIEVFVDRASLPGSGTEVDRQLSAAFDYYRDGANGTVPENVSIVTVDDREAADVVVTAASMDAASNQSLFGTSTDTDPALEYYTEQTISVSTDIDPETLGWHVGYWLGDSLTAAEDPTDLPPPFDNPPLETRRDWWE